jgi:hypothetical protein
MHARKLVGLMMLMGAAGAASARERPAPPEVPGSITLTGTSTYGGRVLEFRIESEVVTWTAGLLRYTGPARFRELHDPSGSVVRTKGEVLLEKTAGGWSLSTYLLQKYDSGSSPMLAWFFVTGGIELPGLPEAGQAWGSSARHVVAEIHFSGYMDQHMEYSQDIGSGTAALVIQEVGPFR